MTLTRVQKTLIARAKKRFGTIKPVAGRTRGFVVYDMCGITVLYYYYNDQFNSTHVEKEVLRKN